MNRRVNALFRLALFATAMTLRTPASDAHFPWLAIDDEGRALLFFSESPVERGYRDHPEAVAKAIVVSRAGAGEPTELKLDSVEVEGFIGRRSEGKVESGAVLESEISYGVYHGTRLDYYARHIPDKAGDLPASGLKLDATPRRTDQGIELVVRWDGKPLAGAGVTLIDRDGVPTEQATDDNGVVRFAAPEPGLIGFLIGRTDDEAQGEIAGQSYKGAMAYGTVTMNFDKVLPAASDAAGLTPLPEALASFGAAVADDWLYVYSGHIGEEHAHSRDNLSTHFRRLNLNAPGEWEELPMQTPLQGLPLVARMGKLYRVGGLSFRNAADEDPNQHSVAEFASFDPDTKTWTALPSLPEARSSHDAVVIGDTLYVVGGWTLSGKSPGEWLSTAWSYDLARPYGEWRQIAAPTFKRRALAAAQWNGKLVALGGMDENAKVSRNVDALDLATGKWSELPKLPRSQMAGFGVSAWNLKGKLIVSGADGVVHQLADDGRAWQQVGELATGRFFHRLMPGPGATLLVVAGASPDDGHLASIESFSPASQN